MRDKGRDSENAMNTASLFRALADDTRRSIVLLLLSGSYCVSALARALNVSESAVSQHLNILRRAGLLTGEKRGHFMHYDIRRERLLELARELEDMAATPRARKEEADPDKNRTSPCPEEVRRRCHGSTHRRTLPMAPLPEKEH